MESRMYTSSAPSHFSLSFGTFQFQRRWASRMSSPRDDWPAHVKDPVWWVRSLGSEGGFGGHSWEVSVQHCKLPTTSWPKSIHLVGSWAYGWGHLHPSQELFRGSHLLPNLPHPLLGCGCTPHSVHHLSCFPLQGLRVWQAHGLFMDPLASSACLTHPLGGGILWWIMGACLGHQTFSPLPQCAGSFWEVSVLPAALQERSTWCC